MANSRKSKLKPSTSQRIAVALSGGLDSVVLLDTVYKAASQGRDAAQEIWVFHIHHGLQKAADQWLVFCEKLAKEYQVHFDFRLLHFQNQAAGNIEARARAGRYEALTELCVEHGIEDLLLAHHQNDQAETVLLQLLRGSGVAGLSAMPQERISTMNGYSISLWRPLLDQSKVDLQAYAKLHKLKWIEDPSNQSTVFRRNAIRKQIIPRLEKIQPEAVANLARSAELLAQSQKLLDRLAIQDGKDIVTCQNLQLSTLLSLADRDLPAANNVIRYWLKSNGLSMPSKERLDAWWQDLWGVKPQAHLEWIHDGASIRLWRGLLQLAQIGAGKWVWVEISQNSKKPGLSAAWVQEAQLAGQIEQRERLGGEKIQIKPNTPRKTLKNLFQEADIPPWERQAPLLFINKELIAVAGIGVSYSHLTTAGKRVLPQWSYQ